jgi:hypothetical protein
MVSVCRSGIMSFRQRAASSDIRWKRFIEIRGLTAADI